MWPNLTEDELMDGVQMALGAMMNQSNRVGRKLHNYEIRWVVRAGFAFRYKGKFPLAEAHRRADIVMESMVEAYPLAAGKLLEKIEKPKDNGMMDSEGEKWLKEGIDFGAPMTIKEVERRAIMAALARTGGNVTQVQRELGMGRSTLYRRLKKYGVLKDDE